MEHHITWDSYTWDSYARGFARIGGVVLRHYDDRVRCRLRHMLPGIVDEP